MKKVWAILIWGVLIFAIGTYLDKVREMLMEGGDVVVTYVVRFGIGFLLVVAVVLVGRWVRGWKVVMKPGGWFVAGAVAWLMRGGLVWWLEPRRYLDLMVHDTFYVIYYPYAAVVLAVIFGIFGAIYLLSPGLNKVMGYVHFWISYAASYVVLWMESKNMGLPVAGAWEFRRFQTYQVVSWAYAVMAILLVAVQVVFVGNLFFMLFWKQRRTGRG